MLAKYPGWTPKRCFRCAPGQSSKPRSDERLSLSETLEQFEDGPDTGVFTDGFCEPNPGCGGWGAVKVEKGAILAERSGLEEQTTNNRMELKALIEGYKILQADEVVDVFTDSQLCVNTITKWADSWKKKGWTRGKKREPVKNLDLVQELYELAQARPLAKLQWIKGHAGMRWNEYADALSRADATAS
ncbi:MAG: ribonuclease HI [Chloroflexi bacterium]|nr:ribonuclease HI [Chloroflexota bacterium]MCI0855168.1 ribonuclease HI [Chloroflexota bacterium]MCI0889319.1 ribonuclease HI [Chloroflexota bacterium]